VKTRASFMVVSAFALAVSAAYSFGATDDLPAPPPGTAAPAPSAPPPKPADAAAAAKPADEANKPPVEVVGPLELSAVKAAVRVLRINQSTCLASTLRLRVKNASSSDVKVALLLTDIGATDDLGQNLLGDPRRIRVSGVTGFATAPRNGWVNFLGESAQNLTALSPAQTVEVQIAPDVPGDWRAIACTLDANSDMMKTYRPKTYSLSGSIGVVDIDGNGQVRSFSLLDVPLATTH
jgi:hypothetical protein